MRGPHGRPARGIGGGYLVAAPRAARRSNPRNFTCMGVPVRAEGRPHPPGRRLVRCWKVRPRQSARSRSSANNPLPSRPNSWGVPHPCPGILLTARPLIPAPCFVRRTRWRGRPRGRLSQTTVCSLAGPRRTRSQLGIERSRVRLLGR